MFRKISVFFLLCIVMQQKATAQSKEEQAVNIALEKLRGAMISGDSTLLASLVWPQLTYGHSGGHIDNAAEFVQKIASGQSDFVSIDISRQQITVISNTAIVRHHLKAVTNDKGQPGEVSLNILLVWQKQKKDWKLLARQAVKAK